MNIKRNSRYKSRGSILVITALAAIVWIFIAQSLFIVGAGGFGMIKSSRVALQAQQYAEIEVDRLKNVVYENLDSNGAHSRQAIANIQESGWEDEVSIGSEHAISGSDDAKQRIATINVYKSGDTLPRFTLEVPLSSQSSSSGESIIFPDGSSWMQVGELIVMRGDADGILEPMITFHDSHKGNSSVQRNLWKHTFPKPFPHKCLQVFWWTNDGSGNDDDSDTYHFVDSSSALAADGFGTEHKHVKYVAFGY